MSNEPLVTGMIEFDANVEALVGATLRIFLENVGMMDAPARPVAEHIDRNFTYSGGKVPFKLYGAISQPDGRYSVRVHVSRSGGSDFESGDFISTQSYPVLTHGNPNHVTIKVQKI